MSEIKRELVRLDLAAALLDVIAEDLAQRPVQEVRGRMVLARELALRINLQPSALASLNLADGDLPDMCDGVAQPDGLGHRECAAWRGDGTVGTYLATGFRIDRSPVEEETNLLPFGYRTVAGELVSGDPAENRTIALHAEPLGAVVGFR